MELAVPKFPGGNEGCWSLVPLSRAAKEAALVSLPDARQFTGTTELNIFIGNSTPADFSLS